MDYHNFLRTEARELRLPYAGHGKATDGKEHFRVRGELAPGWYRFSLEGRFLKAEEEIESELTEWNLPAVRGYLAQGRFVMLDELSKLHGLNEGDVPKRYQPLSGRRWFDGSLWFDCIDFETEAEEAVRQAYEDEESLEGIKGVSPALAQAFVLDSTARAMAREAERRRQEALEAEKKEEARRLWQSSLEGRLATALSHAGAELLDWRSGRRRQVTVRYRLGGQRFECVIDEETLQILDAGICLEGADEELNLSSLPSAVREAIDTGQLYVFRNG